MKKNFVLSTMITFVFLMITYSEAFANSLPVIPGEKGFGMNTPAGSGRHLANPKTNIYKVTNLNNSGPGSLRDGLENARSPKVIIFEVSGAIKLKSPIRISGGDSTKNYITVAGQTAPSPGITLQNEGITIDRSSHDILIQHIRIRVGDILVDGTEGKSEMPDNLSIDNHYDPSKGWYSPHNIVIDHCSLSWSTDITIDSGANNATFSNNIFSEALATPLHPKGPHSKGFLSIAYNYGKSGGKNTVIAKNLFAHIWNRNPEISAGSALVANNLIYSYKGGIKANDGKESKGPIQVSIVGNYLIETGLTERNIYITAGEQSGTRIYVGKDNFFKGKIQKDPWNAITQRIAGNQPGVPVPNWARADSPPVWPRGYTTIPVLSVKDHVLSQAGARPADRDSVDKRIVKNVKNGTGGIIKSQRDVGGWPRLAQNRRTLKIPSDYNKIQRSGYTRLEEWLHEFSRAVEGDSNSIGENSPNPPENLRVLSN